MSNMDFLPGQPQSRSQVRAAAKRARSKTRRRRAAIILTLCALLFAGAIFVAFKVVSPLLGGLGGAQDFAGPGTGEVTIVVEEGEFGNKVARKLVDEGVIASTEAYIKASTANEDSTSIQPGTYTLPQGIPAARAVELLIEGASREQLKVQVIDGRRVSEIVPEVAQQLGISEDESAAGLEAAKAKLPAIAQGEAEGYLFPDTYLVNPDATAQEVYELMIERHDDALTDMGVSDPQERHRMTIEASVIQAEGGDAETMKKIATVIENRIDIGMALQMDSSVAYFHDVRQVDTTQKMRDTDSPYNTYLRKGLPGGPISNPGLAALQAAVNPTPGDWLYFVAVNTCTGETKFAEDYNDHVRNRQEWQDWARETGGCEG